MIKFLRISNIALASGVELELGPGLTVLTGETGAGKSILLDALGLVLGGRAGADLIRTGETKAAVEAIVDLPAIGGWLQEHAIDADGEEVILRREIQSGAKGRATVNGVLVPVALLRELAPRVAAVHGQHEPQGLLDPDSHTPLVDQHGELEELAVEVAAAWQRWQRAESELAGFERDRRELERHREALEQQVAEIERAHLQPGEDTALLREKAVVANADRLAALCAEAYASLYDEDAAILSRLRQVYRKVDDLAALEPRFTAALEARAAVNSALEDLAYTLRDFSDDLQVAPGRLDEIESRLAAIDRLRRKYGATADEVLTFAEDARRQLATLEAPEARREQLSTAATEARARYLDTGRTLSGRRRSAARDLERRMQKGLRELALEGTRFEVRFTPAVEDLSAAGEHGLERGEFFIAPNLGEDLRPLARIASGGELSRLLLALKSAAIREQGHTLVFDEIDAGIGGRVAEVVGRRLRAMAERHQVLCVTHLAPIAAQANTHWRVSKEIRSGRTFTRVHRLEPGERVDELARMLAGERVTDAARKHARELVEAAGE
ncbi:MAG: DNA repair protein RecN [Vicinamibacteria bacterium]|nr:DNA repair protein RecN [Vicinamibacteria bacterium]